MIFVRLNIRTVYEKLLLITFSTVLRATKKKRKMHKKKEGIIWKCHGYPIDAASMFSRRNRFQEVSRRVVVSSRKCVHQALHPEPPNKLRLGAAILQPARCLKSRLLVI